MSKLELSQLVPLRVGIGYDVHKFTLSDNSKTELITICGIRIKHTQKVISHSDGDVGIHALVDAILGAVGCGDIGDHFPDSDSKYKSMESKNFLMYACKKAQEKGYRVSNVDIIIICEYPKINIYKKQMQEYIASLMQIDSTMVNIKATTTEKLGFIGRGEGIAAQAVVNCMLIS